MPTLTNEEKTEYQQQIEKLQNEVRNPSAKISLVIFGKCCSGKTTFINGLLIELLKLQNH